MKNKKRSQEEIDHDNTHGALQPSESPKPATRPHAENITPKSDRGKNKKFSPVVQRIDPLKESPASHQKAIGLAVIGQSSTSPSKRSKVSNGLVTSNIHSPKSNGEEKGLKHTQKKPKKIERSEDSKVSESPKKHLNGSFTPLNSGKRSDISHLFSEHDRLLPGAKRSSMAQEYASSKPYILH